MALIYKKRKRVPSDKDYSYQPFISIIIPTYNEDQVIKRRIENLLAQDYPRDKFEILVVDSGSTDATVKTAKELASDNQNVTVLTEGERKGKASAINFGKSYAKGEIVLVTDANTIYDINVLKKVAPYFKNPGIGAVGGRFILSNVDNNLVRSSSFYWELESLINRGESTLDSVCFFHGEINAWRKNIVEADTTALSEDVDMAIKIRRQGYKIAYEPDAMAYEAGPTTTREQIIQKKRTTLGVIKNFFKHKRYLWLPRDKYSGLIFPCHKTLQILSPYLLIVALAMFITLLALQKFAISIAYLSAVAILFSLSLAILNREVLGIRVINNPKVKVALSSNLWNIFSYVLLHEFIILLAWRDFVLNRYAVTWQKAESTRT